MFVCITYMFVLCVENGSWSISKSNSNSIWLYLMFLWKRLTGPLSAVQWTKSTSRLRHSAPKRLAYFHRLNYLVRVYFVRVCSMSEKSLELQRVRPWKFPSTNSGMFCMNFEYRRLDIARCHAPYSFRNLRWFPPFKLHAFLSVYIIDGWFPLLFYYYLCSSECATTEQRT